MMHEASLHEDNCFVTLTYDAEHLPADMSLDVRHWQLFAKRLRKRVGPFRFFHCGEYGERLSRPHYHAVFFGLDFPDRVLYTERGGVRLDTSAVLESVWGKGFCTVGAVTFESCAYVARYVLKKVNGDDAFHHYMILDERTGELTSVAPEYVTMSRGGRHGKGIAASWFNRFGNEVYPSDEVISRGHPAKPPRYYDKLQELVDPTVLETVKRSRVKRAKVHAVDQTPERLSVRERCAKARLTLYKRPLG